MQQQQYFDNERTLCFHGPLIYEAILKSENWTDPKKHNGQTGPHYFVHYKGWKQTWDEWVAETRLLKWNEENIARQKELFEQQRQKDRAEREAAKAGNLDTSLNSKRDKGSAAAYASSGVNAGARGTKRARESIAEEEDFKNRPEIKLVIPDVLKVKLVDDWEAITKNSQLVPLPRKPSVSDILKEYEEASTSAGGTRSASLTHEVVSGLKLYFDKSLGNNLLYRFERNQYGEIRRKHILEAGGDASKDTTEMSDIYGVEHLLRLFELIAHTSMDAETVTVLREALQDLMRWIVQEKDRLFNVKYEETSSAYQSLSKQ